MKIMTAALALISTAALADNITLKPAVRLSASSSVVKLKDIAELDGPEAESFADVAIADLQGARGVVEIPVTDVRARLDEAGAHWGRINLSGRQVTVRANRGGDGAPPLAMTPVSLNESPPSVNANSEPAVDERLAADLMQLPTVRGRIAQLLTASLHVNAGDLKLIFNHDDIAVLDAAQQGARYDIEPLCDFHSERVNFAVRTWSAGRVGQRKTIGVVPLVRIHAAVPARTLEPDETIAAGDLEARELWLPAVKAQRVLAAALLAGRIVTRRIEAGQPINDGDVRRETLVKRGEQIMVRCLVGGVAISLQAEARADGREGETIEFRKPGERDTFLATITGRGEAVVDLSAQKSASRNTQS